VSFTVYEGDEGVVGSSSLNHDWKDSESHKSHEVITPIVPLADLVGDEQIDILKLDCEGYSYDVLIGLGQKIKQVRVLHIETETWTASDKAVEAYMELMGFDIFDVREQYSGMPDYTFARRDLEI
jgi:FkbM family methyltransferase